MIRFIYFIPSIRPNVLSLTASNTPRPPLQACLCSVGEVLEGEGASVYGTVGLLLSVAPPPTSRSPLVQLAGFALFYLSVMSVLCTVYLHLVPYF